jgi:cytochrome c551/c552
MVVDPTMPIPNVRSPYDPEEDIEEEGKEHDDDDTPEVTINAATQIRGHGNIISIAQMDSVRIANLITSLLSGEKTTPDLACPSTPPTVSASAASPQHTSRTEVRGVKKFPNINITVNCGATIIGDRNIVGPGLGDIARQMQMAQRNQALLAQQQAAAVANGQKMPSPPLQRRDTLYQAQAAMAQHHHGVPSPPMSRSSSLGSEAASMKRKADGGGGESAKRHC